MHFWKYCGAGNDFVILENFDGSIAPERYAALAAALCREHFSVGADGLMIEVHNDPKNALCDGAQSLTPAQFDELMQDVKRRAAFEGKRMAR